MDQEIDVRNYEELNQAIALAQHTVYKLYLPELENYPVVEPTERLMDETTEDSVRFIRLEELSCKRGEDIFQKLSTVYFASMALGCNLLVMIDVERMDAPAKIYLGLRRGNEDNEAEAKNHLVTSFQTLRSSLESNFPGTNASPVSSQDEMPKLVDEIFGENIKYISSVSCVAAARDKSKTENKSFVQGIEKFIDTMRGNAYTALFIAEPLTTSEQAVIRNGYENLYSILSSFRKSTWSFNENESKAVMESLCSGVSKSVTEGSSHTQGHTWSAGVNIGIGGSRSNADTISHSNSETHGGPTVVAKTGQAIAGMGKIAGLVGKVAAISCIPGVSEAGLAMSAVAGIAGVAGNMMQGGTKSHTETGSVAQTIGKSLGLNGGLNFGYARTQSDTDMKMESDTQSDSKTTGTTETKGKGKNLQIENVNKSVDEMMKRIDEQLERTKEGEDYGAYSCSAYFLSGKQDSSVLAANTYRALMIGEGSSVESGAVNCWNGNKEKEKVAVLKEYLRRFVHPVFAVATTPQPQDGSDFITYTAGTTVSGTELSLHLGLPTKSVYGLPVVEHAEFGRNITKQAVSEEDKRTVCIGKIYHMGKCEDKSVAELNVSNLAAHTFITGSTGSGKSNLIYHILDSLSKQQIHFLVVEPAKGEYRQKFAFRNDVSVYGTNQKIAGTEMLRINPFSFPESIHVLEHMDRLVEIFNVCWPMYAAMPAILKDSIQRAYEVAGWDMENSVNVYDNRIFPTFTDVYKQIRLVLEESEYSQDNKSDYTGSLVTRLRSLTNGINGLIFTPDEISMDKLFDTNVIIDLSRIGSVETKSFIMGLLVLKLQEHRMDGAFVPDQVLHHVTVLEEAHNLLRRTSTEQITEGSNLLGKSVEMLANSIAEMRTYGEGFMIADQSPGLLDMSVIRNTNTKIILRLPDYSDRELVGRAAGLNDDQIIELAKLDRGVAVVKQSEWLEAVLCQIDKHQPSAMETQSPPPSDPVKEPNLIDSNKVSRSLLECIMNNELHRRGERIDIQKLKDIIVRSKISAEVKREYFEYISADADQAVSSLRKLVYDFFGAEDAIRETVNDLEISKWVKAVAEKLNPSVEEYSSSQIDLLMALILYEKAERDVRYSERLKSFTKFCQENGGVIL